MVSGACAGERSPLLVGDKRGTCQLFCFNRDLCRHRIGNETFAVSLLMERVYLFLSRKSRSTENHLRMLDDTCNGKLCVLIFFQ